MGYSFCWPSYANAPYMIAPTGRVIQLYTKGHVPYVRTKQMVEHGFAFRSIDEKDWHVASGIQVSMFQKPKKDKVEFKNVTRRTTIEVETGKNRRLKGK